MDQGTFPYNLVLFLHILSVIVGFGGIVLNGVYGAIAKKRGGREGAAIASANLAVSHIAQKVIFVIPLFGISLVIMDDSISFGDMWVYTAITLYAVAISIAIFLLSPTQRRLVSILEGSISTDVSPAVLGKKLAIWGGTTQLIMWTVITLMVFKPGA